MAAISRRQRAIHAVTCCWRSSAISSKRAAVALQGGLAARHALPPFDDHIDVLGVQFDAPADALGDFRGGERGAAAQERLVHRFAALRVVQQRAPHEFHWLLGWVIDTFPRRSRP